MEQDLTALGSVHTQNKKMVPSPNSLQSKYQTRESVESKNRQVHKEIIR